MDGFGFLVSIAALILAIIALNKISRLDTIIAQLKLQLGQFSDELQRLRQTPEKEPPAEVKKAKRSAAAAKKPEPEIPEKVTIPDFAHLLPEPIRRFTQPAEIHDADHLSFLQGGGHGGSHPHLVHEFISALVEDRDPRPNAVTSANWTCVGICAHESANKGGEIVRLPEFTLS